MNWHLLYYSQLSWVQRQTPAGEVADDVDIESLGFAHKYDITGAPSTWDDSHGSPTGWKIWLP